MLVTTYRHDYVPPYTKRYDFTHGANAAEKEVCECSEEPKIEIPKAAQDCQNVVEWTGIAPMGRLIDPRIIPTKFSPEQIDDMAKDATGNCNEMQPNRFLKILRTAYPDLYERLKQMPKDELNRRLDRERLVTTYQIDYCDMNEYPEGVYESLKQEEDTSKSNASKLLQYQGPCSDFRENVMQEMGRAKADGFQSKTEPCIKGYKPFKISFADSSRFIASGNNSHWRTNIFAKKSDFSEYMDTINKNGCVIMRNRIHDHAKCANGKHCRHQIVHTCANLR